jgi:E3 ubiquitin-protein ligase HUWE1
MDQFSRINPFKELKIIFIGEESHDAGGLIREWLTILFKKILDKDTGLFERSDTDEIGYIIKQDLCPSQDNLNKYFFIGRILAKALLENLTVNCCFNKVVYQLLLGETIQLNDLVFIDRPLYNSMKHLVKMREECGENIALCEIYFTYEYEGTDGTHYQQDLIENGSDILVTQDNLDLYIQKRIEYYTKSQMGGIKQIISGINTIFPVDYLKIFTSDQLGLLINGTPFIDTEDWRMNTIYKNYNDYDNVILNFWDIISNLSQEDLANFLLFCTGSSRVPIGGFKSLESNRGQISKFEIVKTEYYAGKKNFLRAHTCFNRLDLPNFPDKNSLNDAVKFALENEVLGFGIE